MQLCKYFKMQGVKIIYIMSHSFFELFVSKWELESHQNCPRYRTNLNTKTTATLGQQDHWFLEISN